MNMFTFLAWQREHLRPAGIDVEVALPACAASPVGSLRQRIWDRAAGVGFVVVTAESPA
jgi:hypothetical protein